MTNDQAILLNPGDPIYQPLVNPDTDPVSWQVNQHAFVRLFGLSLIVTNPHQGEHDMLVSAGFPTRSAALGWIAGVVGRRRELLSTAEDRLFDERRMALKDEGQK